MNQLSTHIGMEMKKASYRTGDNWPQQGGGGPNVIINNKSATAEGLRVGFQIWHLLQHQDYIIIESRLKDMHEILYSLFI